MDQFFSTLAHLEMRLLHNGLAPETPDRTATAVFQIVAGTISEFRVQSHVPARLTFEALYLHRGEFHPHPYTLRTRETSSVNRNIPLAVPQYITYEISLFLELKRLQDFHIDDIKRYYQAIDENLDTRNSLCDFHEVYLALHYDSDGQSGVFKCNGGQPMYLPTLIPNLWTHTNTSTRFRYDAENRDGTFPCEMTLRHTSLDQLQSYKIVLCLVSNTIPPQMDYHAIRWFCKLKTKITNQKETAKRVAEKEKSYILNHPSGIIVAQVFGPALRFTPQMLQFTDLTNYVRSYYEPDGFRKDLENSAHQENSAVAVVVTKAVDYPEHMKNRRRDGNVLRYLPFRELADTQSSSDMNEEKIIKRLKIHKEQCSKQLTLNNNEEHGTYSQAHVRLYVAAYNEHDILLAETLHPPLRNSKTFEQLRILRLVQPKCDLRANEPAFVYCEYDHSKSKSEYQTCPYEFQMVFLLTMQKPNINQLLKLFDQPHLVAKASYVPNCPCLLQFQVPNDTRYDQHRTFIRLRHAHSKDYNPSAIALNDQQCWTYYGDPTSVMDLKAGHAINEATNSAANANEQIILTIQPVDLYVPSECGKSNEEHSIAPHNNDLDLHTPDFESVSVGRFEFADLPSWSDDQ